MKLLTLTTRYYLLLFLLILGIWSLVFYAVMRYEVYENSDEILLNRKNQVLGIIKQSREVPLAKDEYNDFVIHPLSSGLLPNTQDMYGDTLIYEPTDNEFDEYRKLTTRFTFDKKSYGMVIFKPRLETTEIVNTIAITLLSLYAVLVLALAFTSRKLSKKLWQPFYSTLNRLREYRLDQESSLLLDPTRIKEFEQLNQSIEQLTGKNRQIYLNQKQFIENASHEIQTPLAIIQSQIELLFQNSTLEESQSEILHEILSQTDRLSKLNNALLLLSKIENNQFFDKTRVLIKPLVEKILTYFEEHTEKYALQVSVDIPLNAHVHTNPMLMEILLSNLIKNAFVHNKQNGFIRVAVIEKIILVENTGEELAISPDTLFERFRKQSKSKGALGLGLAIVKTICEINKWKVNYNYQDNLHKISVQF
ncbi:HAMP domain-containing sensor histidine kinase [Rhodocytophaga aerolata]|uniref:histidine kinase n=1 Tax=Rhodocytophaga aerolata TaxID=455078 RepID=A0ABT8RC82_9BACT|nr:HAMP domain-containing sensor histidine kinase [Rhodocytophaga aerolata]MDO1449614.1 HAMP domain-containing sensor histidine kinase [Rhodocytophaga aerolata]